MQTNTLIKETIETDASMERHLTRYRQATRESTQPQNTLEAVYTAIASITALEEFF